MRRYQRYSNVLKGDRSILLLLWCFVVSVAYAHFKVSGRTGEGVEKLFYNIIDRVPPPKGDATAPLRALLFDSWFDVYRGVICILRVIDGSVRRGVFDASFLSFFVVGARIRIAQRLILRTV